MATAEGVKAKLEGLIGAANGATGRSDATLTAAVAALISGFGQGGASVQTGQFTPAENLGGIVLDVNGICSNFVLWRVSQELPGDLRILQRFISLDLTAAGGTACFHTLATNGTGTTINACVYGDAPGVAYEAGKVNFTFNPTAFGWGYLAAGYEYRWLAW